MIDYNRRKIIKSGPRLIYVGDFTGSVETTYTRSNHCELLLALEGGGVINGEEFAEGSVAIYNPGESRDELLAHNCKTILIALDNFRIESLPANHITEKNFSIVSCGRLYDSISSLFKQINEEYREKMPLKRPILDMLVKTLLLHIVRLTAFEEKMADYNRDFDSAKEYFEENYLTITNIDEACRHIGIDKFRLARLFKERLGTSPLKFITEKRILRAKQLLSDTSYGNSEIAKACGYDDAPYFCRVFKKQTGISPMQYRRAIRKKRFYANAD